MSAIRGGAWALIAGSVMTCLVFAFHPGHIDTRPVLGSFNLSQLIHSAAILAAPLLILGMWDMARWIGPERPSNRLALICGVIAMILTVNAAVVSSFVTPAAAKASSAAISAMHAAAAGQAHSSSVAGAHGMHMGHMPPLVQLSVSLNRGLAQVHVAMLSIAILLFGFGLWSRSRLLSAAGLAVGAFPLVWQLSGTFTPETHTMPLIVFTQSAWLIAVAVRMLANRESMALPHGDPTVPV